MRRIAAGLVLGLLAASGASGAPADDPPPLAPPVGAPAIEPPAEMPPPKEAKPIDENRPMLVIPGVTTPRPGARPRTPGAPASPARTAVPIPAPAAASAVPPLLGPAEMPRTAPPRRPVGTADNGRAGLPTTIESVPAPAGEGVRERRSAKPSATTVRPLDDDPLDRPAKPPAPPARRAQGFFGRFLPPQPAQRAPASASGRENVRVEPRSDPATDSAVKRRIERQLTETLGSRVRAYEVRVVGRNVVIRAVPARFWQRRAVRSSIESLPVLTGFKTTVLIDE